MCQRYGLKPYRERGRRYSTVLLRAPDRAARAELRAARVPEAARALEAPAVPAAAARERAGAAAAAERPAAGSLTTLSVKYDITIDNGFPFPAGVTLVAPTYPAVVDAAWSASTMAFLDVVIASTASGATAPCDDKGGVTFAVAGL